MAAESPVYNELNKAWKATCRILLKEEVGELEEYESWLSECLGRSRIERSAISGKEVHFPVDEYCKNAKFMSFDEADFSKEFEPLNINEVKDIDSIVEAVRERAHYTGDMIIGNSKFVAGSSNIIDSHFVYKSYVLSDCKNVAYSRYLRDCDFFFGVDNAGLSSYAVRGMHGLRFQRVFEYHNITNSSDIYYSANLNGCIDCLFCFNKRNIRHAIGNLELPNDVYGELKKKLVAEIADGLRRKKLPSLYQIVSQLPDEKPDLASLKTEPEHFDLSPIEKAFRSTYRVVLKREPKHPIGAYREVMLKHVPDVAVLRDPISGEETAASGPLRAKNIPPNRLVTHRGAEALMERAQQLSIEEVKRISISDPSVLSKIAYINSEIVQGQNENNGKIDIFGNSVNNYFGTWCFFAKNCAFFFWPPNSDHVFGANVLFDGHFCIRCYHSKGLTRSFEADSCKNSSDIYFCHNCENMHDSMFCFNAKNMKNAIGNAPLQTDKYQSVKSSILEQVADELDSNKGLKYDIYNIGCAGAERD